MWLKKWRKKQAILRTSLKKTYLYRIWGHKLFTDVLWRIDKRSISGGLALGLFVAFTPTIPFQMLLTVCGGLYFRVNLPIALAACWVTNPLTAVPIYTAAWRLGKYVVENAAPVKEAFEAYNIEGKATRIIQQGFYLWTGSLIFSSTSALSSNLAIRAIWKLAHKSGRSKKQNKQPKLTASKKQTDNT
ncbi:MAG: DUF2062 domain-containing protein [Sedimentisphaerales bacterium]|nr:DUF2062 domain-containing protein [Sedimentisphaerales bacterium]